MGYYPQTPDDEELFNNFRDVVYKYNQLKVDGMVTLPANGIYPRLSISHNRGIRAGEELLNFLCKNLINNPPISLLEDIKDAEFILHKLNGVLGSSKPVSFMVLGTDIPEYKRLNIKPAYRPEFYKLYVKQI
jgi:hypothetical protein